MLRLRFVAIAAVALPALAACGDSASSPTESMTPTPPANTCTPSVTVDLQVGQTMALTSAQAACFALAPHAGARYALAGYDARALEAAERGPGAGPHDEPAYLLGDGAVASAALAPSRAPSAAVAPGDLRVSAAAVGSEATDPYARARPWAAGETFQLKRIGTNDLATARVVAVQGGVALAALEPDAASARRMVDDTKAALAWMAADGFRSLARAFGPSAPRTSEGAGQLLVVLASWNPDQGAGGTFTRVDAAGGAYSIVWMNMEMRGGVRPGFDTYDHVSFRLKVLAHELTHAWQMRWLDATVPAGGRHGLTDGPVWGLEGGADLLAMDAVRRNLGVAAEGNWDWDAHLVADDRAVTYAMEPADTRGRLGRGYFDAASFLRHAQARMARAGMDRDAALAEVARGAAEGWYGWDGAGNHRTGLAARVRAAAGGDWDPAHEVLTWTLAQALDDETANPALNNAAFWRVSSGRWAWQPVAEEMVAGGAGERRFSYQAAGSFFVRVRDGGGGGTLSARSAAGGTRWMIARAR